MKERNEELKKELIKESSDEVSREGALSRIDEAEIPAEEDFIGEFPCGVFVNDTLTKEFEVREMDGADEEALNAVAKKNGGAKVINRLLERCIVRIGSMYQKDTSVDAWRAKIASITIPDQDYALMKIRSVSMGKELECSTECPDCGNKIKTFFSVDELEVRPYAGDKSQSVTFTLPRGYVDEKGEVHKEVRMRIPNGLDREVALPVARRNESKGVTLMLTRICKFTDGYPMSEDVLRKMKIRDRQEIEKQNRDLVAFGYDLTVEAECPSCGLEFPVALSNVLKNFL